MSLFEGNIVPSPLVERRFYSWNFPGAPIKVELELGVVDQIRRQMDAVTGEDEGDERGGLLLGETRNGTVFVTGCIPVEPLTVAAFEAAVEGRKSAGRGSDAVGFYRIDRGESLHLAPQDVEIARKAFPAPDAVVLLAQPRPQSLPAATFFFREDGQLLGEFAFLEFPFDSQLLEIERRGKQAAQASEPFSEPSIEIAAPARSLRRWRVRVPLTAVTWTAAVLALAAAGAGVVWFVSQTRTPASPAAPTSQLSSGPRPAGFNLRAERSGADYILSWNRNSPAVTSALWGLLSIEDGGSRRDISLQADQLRSGSVLYQPTNDEIRFKLSLVGPDQHVEMESVTVIRAATAAAAENAGSRQAKGAVKPAPDRVRRNSAIDQLKAPPKSSRAVENDRE